MDLWAGTSGYSYKEWKGSFYPEKIAASDMLRHYATRLSSVEINSTFYRLPRASVLETWVGEVPDSFRFVIKASRRITHLKRLKDAAEETGYLLDTLQALGNRLGAILFQLPPNLKKDVPRLEAFLELLPPAAAAAFEFRHESWLDDEVHACLRRRNFALCAADTGEEEGGETPLPATADWGYLRLRRDDYSADDLEAWSGRIREQGWIRAYVFFKHEDGAAGPRMAEEFTKRFESDG